MYFSIWAWLAVTLIVVAALAVDLFVFHRKPHEVTLKEASIASAVWVALGLTFGAALWFIYGAEAAGEYYAGYVIEKALSVENIFVFALLLGAFAVPTQYQHRLLFLGVIGALVFRAIAIGIGAALLDAFTWVVFIFGAFLIYTGVRMARPKQMEIPTDKNPVVRLVGKFVPTTNEWHGQRLFTRIDGRRYATPMFAALLAIETTDVIFALDSIPAIFSTTDQAFIVFASNAFAICGLRALYFLLSGAMDKFPYLKLGLSVVLVVAGIKLIIKEWYHVPTAASLAIIVLIIATSIVASLMKRPTSKVA